MEKNKVLIGIPAYNEEQNIGLLLNDLIAQEFKDLTITILVVSDCSSDNTSQIVRSFEDKRVELLELTSRTGLAGVENSILERSQEFDAVLIINADMRVKDKQLVNKLVRPVLDEGFDLTSCSLVESSQHTFVGQALASGNRIKRSAFRKYKNGDNWFNCHGGVRAFSKNLLTKFRFKVGVWEDLYSYLYIKKNGYKFKFVDNTEVIYSIPDNLEDHFKQGERFFTNKDYISSEFGTSLVYENTKWPVFIIALVSFFEFTKHPIYSLGYLGIFLITMFRSKAVPRKQANVWDSSSSTRKVNI